MSQRRGVERLPGSIREAQGDNRQQIILKTYLLLNLGRNNASVSSLRHSSAIIYPMIVIIIGRQAAEGARTDGRDADGGDDDDRNSAREDVVVTA